MARSHQAPQPAPPPEGGRLYIVATPIGNLEDITLRALRVLREVDLVCAEDTRRSGNLLRHFGIATPLSSLHAHNEGLRLAGLVRRLTAGERVALVSDAGTPGISDPGMQLVSAAREAGVAVEVIPGPSAVVAALAACGLADQPFAFLGFPVTRSKDRKTWFLRLAALEEMVVVCFEAPHRVLRLLADLSLYGVERPIFVARELTKVHEEVLRGSPKELRERIITPQGEFTLVIPPRDEVESGHEAVSEAQVISMFGQMTENSGSSLRATARQVAERTGLTTKQVYGIIERHKNRSKDRT